MLAHYRELGQMATVKSPRWPKDPPRALVGKPTKTAANIRMEKSVLMERDLAERACLALNALATIVNAWIAETEVVRDHHATAETHGEERFYVRWLRRTDKPLTEATVYVEETDAPLRPDQIKAQITRAERAARQYCEMAFFPCEGSEEGAFWCLHFKEEETSVYVVRPEVSCCSCPDWFYRKNLHDGRCKHVLGYLIHAGLPLRKRSAAMDAATLDAHIRANINLDF